MGYICRTFAHLTVKDRMPRILTQVIDTVNQEEKNVFKTHGEVSGLCLPPENYFDDFRILLLTMMVLYFISSILIVIKVMNIRADLILIFCCSGC